MFLAWGFRVQDFASDALGAGLLIPPHLVARLPTTGDLRSLKWLGGETGHSAFWDRLLRVAG